MATTDPHSPDRFRANGVLVNMPEFGNAFNCKVGQPMMPAKTCRVLGKGRQQSQKSAADN